ncbi:MAG: DUF5721 family protein [Brotaphodocola sp.]
MVALKMEDLKCFTSNLFVGDVFDTWLVREVSIVTFNTFRIDGRVRQGYYSDEELELKKIEELSAWKTLKPFCFSLIKGKKLPESFQITLQLSSADVEVFLKYAELDIRADQIGGLYLNIRYENGTLHCVTGTSLKIFTLDHQIEVEWDAAVKLFMKQKEMPYTAA